MIECFTEKSTLFPHCFQSQIVVRHGLSSADIESMKIVGVDAGDVGSKLEAIGTNVSWIRDQVDTMSSSATGSGDWSTSATVASKQQSLETDVEALTRDVRQLVERVDALERR